MRPEPQQIPASFSLSREEFEAIATLVRGETGIVIRESKKPLVASRLSRRLRSLNIGSVAEYWKFLEGPDGESELKRLISAMTTNMTRFYREAHHFQHLEQVVLPHLIQRARQGGRVRFWSAGCSSGEEAYTLAFTVLGSCPDAARHDVRILATDIDQKIIHKAREGIYPAEQLQQVPGPVLRAFFERLPGNHDHYVVKEAGRALISFRELNLFHPWPFHGKFDVIMCRNVMIYFDEQAQADLLRRIHDRLQPGGHLYIGHSERIPEALDGHFRHVGTGTFQRRDEPEAGPRSANLASLEERT